MPLFIWTISSTIPFLDFLILSGKGEWELNPSWQHGPVEAKRAEKCPFVTYLEKNEERGPHDLGKFDFELGTVTA